MRQLREQAYLTQEELAARAEVSRATVQNIENDRGAPRHAVLRRIATALGVDIAELQRLRGDGVTADDLRILIADQEQQLDDAQTSRVPKAVTTYIERRLADLRRQLDELTSE